MSERPRIYSVLPDEIKDGFPHGQWLFDTPGLVLNFLTEVDPVESYLPLLEPMVKKLAAFIKSDEPFMEFESPHTPGINYLHRTAAARIMATNPAWSKKIYARTRSDGGGAQIINENGLPVIRKLRN
jgi:hypothetical protein